MTKLLPAVEQPIEFIPAPEASTVAEAKLYASQEMQSSIAAFVIRSANWQSMEATSGTDNLPSLLFAESLGAKVQESRITYEFDGPQPWEAHVDEVPEDLLHLRHFGMFNIHHCQVGSVSSRMVHTQPGYYAQEPESRVQRTTANFGITQDLLRGKLINTYTSATQVYEARLNPDDRIIFFERGAITVDGPPNVIHLFYQGTILRHSETTRYFSETS